MPDAQRTAGPSNELRTRILSALVLAPVALGLTWYGSWPFAALIAAASIVMAFELTNLLPGLSPTLRILLASTVFGAIVFTGLGGPFVALIVTLACLTFAMMIAAFTGAGAQIPTLAFCFPYVVLPAVALVWLRLDPEFGRLAIFWLLFVVWATDTFAYFAGRGFGGPKLAPRLSPNKTWAGLIGGMVGAAIFWKAPSSAARASRIRASSFPAMAASSTAWMALSQPHSPQVSLPCFMRASALLQGC